MKPAPFAYARPTELEEVLRLLADHGGDVKLLAGGQSLVPMMNFRMTQPDLLVDISRIEGLAGICEQENSIRIGAMTRHVDVKSSSLVEKRCPLISLAYEHIAHETVRNRGTIGGNLAHADPASELPAVMIVLDAVMVVRSRGGERLVAASDFFVSALTSDLRPDEMLIEIRVPCLDETDRVAIDEFAPRKGDLAVAGVAVRLAQINGKCTAARIAMFGVADRPLQVPAAERLLVGSECSESSVSEVAHLVMQTATFEAGPGISAAYRRDVTGALVRRTVLSAWNSTRSIQ